MSKEVRVEEVKAKSMPGVEIPARMYLEDDLFRATVENGDWQRVHCGRAIDWSSEYKSLGPPNKEEILRIIAFLHRVVWAMEATG